MGLELKDQKNSITARDFFFSVQKMYKAWDYRCLVPYSHKDPTKWMTYEMHDYRKASNQEELERVDKFKYDNNFFNWEDPRVLKYFTKSNKSMKKAWKKTYGFPYKNELSERMGWGMKCYKKCARYVSSYSSS